MSVVRSCEIGGPTCITSYFRSHFGSRIVRTNFASLRRAAGCPSSMPPKGHVKDCSSLGSVIQHHDKWRVRLRLLGRQIFGPARASAAEAAADLTRARALPRQQISAFLNGLRDQLPVESTSCSSTAPGSANQQALQTRVLASAPYQTSLLHLQLSKNLEATMSVSLRLVLTCSRTAALMLLLLRKARATIRTLLDSRRFSLFRNLASAQNLATLHHLQLTRN